MSKTYRYGKDPNPKSWHETADALRSLKVKLAKKKEDGVLMKMASIESMLKKKEKG